MPEIIKIADCDELKRCIGDVLIERLPDIISATLIAIGKNAPQYDEAHPKAEERLIGIYDVAQKLGVSKSKLETMLKADEAPQPWTKEKNNRGKRLWRVSDINDFIAGQPNDTTEIRP